MRVIAGQTIVIHTGTNTATLVLASLGVVLALLSLGWQAASLIVTGSRISVEVRPGLKGLGAVVTMPPKVTREEKAFMRSQGYTDPVFAVRVNNAGRGSTSVVSVDLAFDNGGAVDSTAHDPPLPFRLEGEGEQTWYIDAPAVLAFAKTAEQIQPTGKAYFVRGRVKLGSKRVVLSKNRVPVPSE